VNPLTGEVVADGHVRIEEVGQIWEGEHVNYNFKTHVMQTTQFRTGKSPVYAAGRRFVRQYVQSRLHRAAYFCDDG